MIKELDFSDLTELNTLASNFNIVLTDYDFNKSNNFFLGYLISNKLVAFLEYSIYYERGELDYLFVLEDYRRQNIASILLKYMLSTNSYLDNFTLEVRESNIVAINLYKKFGFEVCAVRKMYYGNESALLMIKKFGDKNGR